MYAMGFVESALALDGLRKAYLRAKRAGRHEMMRTIEKTGRAIRILIADGATASVALQLATQARAKDLKAEQEKAIEEANTGLLELAKLARGLTEEVATST